MVAAAKSARFLQRQNISWLFHHAEKTSDARFVRTDFAEFLRGEKTALHAGMDDSARVSDGARDPFRLFLTRLHNPERDALR